ncbi:helix-turn-helix domain-containing protein [Diaphorobacter sp. HDW4A]|uniref:IclR family transcriptional regulator domain-containing protein n=1 Tax=Diaphorobacter sp. HDW4A TaxID=2714924 RepID=UPI00140B712F|nr:IclR family transcriptional regulator C-terminal domain-containing protein [Diaphorobacter sp. HDW4A]QIL83466.1 helix-turn-helix domain-containing protein [Diaphorobacter sp. HDW4A]
MTAPTPGDTYVQSFARGLEVIRSFNANAPEQTLSEVAAQTGLTRAGARRILLTLQTLGYVTSDERHFRLTPKILDLGFAYLTSMPMWDLAEPLMDQLVEKVHESCSTAVLDDLEIVYVLRVHTHKIMSTNLSVGSRLPAFWTSLGRVLLAGLPEDDLQDRLARLPRKQYTQYTAMDDATLLTRIREAREQGWCLLNQELEEGLTSIAAPIKDRAGNIIAALNISGQSNRTSVEMMKNELLPQLLQTSQAISRLMVTRRR